MGLSVRTMESDVGGSAMGDRLSERPNRETLFAEVAERHARFMFRVAHGLLRNVHDAEDAVQDCLLKLYRGDAWLRMEDERAFIARVAWRSALDVASRRPAATQQMDEALEGRLIAKGNSPEQAASENDNHALLHRLVNSLPEDLRQPLVLSAIEEMTSREVAEAMGIPEGTVRTRIMRARAELRRRFETIRTKGIRR